MFCVTKVVCVVFLFSSFSRSLCFSESLTRPNFCSHCVSSFPTECLTSSNWNPPKTGYSHLLILSLSPKPYLLSFLSPHCWKQEHNLWKKSTVLFVVCVSVYIGLRVCVIRRTSGGCTSLLCVCISSLQATGVKLVSVVNILRRRVVFVVLFFKWNFFVLLIYYKNLRWGFHLLFSKKVLAPWFRL